MNKLEAGSTILFQGDSITDGGRGGDKNKDLGQGYVYGVASELAEKYAEKNYTFINRGISAHKVTDLYARWQTDTIVYEPDLLSILVGVNDAGTMVRDQSTTKIRDWYERVYKLLIEDTLAALPDTKLVLMEPFILDGAIQDPQRADFIKKMCVRIQDKQEVVAKLAKEYACIYVPLQQGFTQAATRNDALYWVWDGVHPTYAGHRLISQQWLKVVEEYIQF